MSRLTEALIEGRFAGRPRSARRRETELAEACSDAWRKTFLREHDASGADLWLFSYGSLMWSGELELPERRLARVHGWHRRFCLLQWAWRGDLDNPCLMLALDRGGACQGVVHRLPGPNVSEHVKPVWDREMSGDGYRPRWVTARTSAGAVGALAFVIHREGERYAGRLSEAETARRIAAASGESGPCAEYLRRTVCAIEALGLNDRHLERLERLVARDLGEKR